MNKCELDRLNYLGDKLEAIYKSLDIDQYTSPLNRKEEEAKINVAFESGWVYNPQFRYKQAPIQWAIDIHKFLQGFIPENVWEQRLYNDARMKLDELNWIRSRNPEEITTYSIERYGTIDDSLLDIAYQFLNSENAVSSAIEDISARDGASHIWRALEYADLNQWTVVLEERMSAKMSVNGTERRIRVRADARFNQQQLDRLLVHEIGTHVFRYMNGMSNQLRLLRLGLENYAVTEEGLAAYHEQKYRLCSPTTFRRYALRVIAAHLSLEHSFFDVFVHLRHFTDAKTAYEISVRAKRAMEDTGKKGSHVKDKVYFEGLQVISQHLKSNPDDYPALMSGKVSMTMLPELHQLFEKELVSFPRYLPSRLLKLIESDSYQAMQVQG